MLKLIQTCVMRLICLQQ